MPYRHEAGRDSRRKEDAGNRGERHRIPLLGNTSLLPLRHIVPANGGRILLKLESEYPTGSMKDRMGYGDEYLKKFGDRLD